MLVEESFPNGGDRSQHYPTKRQLLPHLEAFLLNTDNWIVSKPEEDKQKLENDYLDSLLMLMVNGYSDLGNPKKKGIARTGYKYARKTL